MVKVGPRSISIWKALGLAAVVGTAAGVILAAVQRPPEDLEMETQALASQLIPTGDPMPIPAKAEAPFVDMMAPDPRSLRGLPPYPGAEPRRIVGSRPGADQTLAISWFTTGDSVEDVLTFYERAFSESNLFYTSHRYSERRGYVSWFEHETAEGKMVFGKGVLHMVAVSKEGSNTTVMLSATEPQKILENLTPLPSGVRIPPGPTPQVINLSEFGQQRATVIATYDYGRDRLIDNLQTLWKETGWREVGRSEGEGGTTVVVVLNQRQQTVVIDGRGEQSELLITVEERRASEGVGP